MAITINGSGTVTGVSVGGLPDGIVDAGTLASNSVETAKISDDAVTVAKMADAVVNYDEWWYTSDLSLSDDSADSLTANLTRQTAKSVIGSAMTESSGVFTFPETGIWYINAYGNFYRSGGDRRGVGWYLRYTSNDGGAWSTISSAHSNFRNGGGTNYASPQVQASVDITDTSNQKVLFQVWCNNNGAHLSGTSSYDSVSFRFTKLGAT